jgi:hypothetical protein
MRQGATRAQERTFPGETTQAAPTAGPLRNSAIVRQRQQVAGRPTVQMGIRGTAALQKCVDLVLALRLEHRAGRVQQPAAGLEGGPQRVQQLGLDARQRRDVLGAAQPADVGVAAHDARGAARGVQQDGVEGLAVPPVGRAAAVARAGAAAQAQAREGVVHAQQALRVGVERQHVEVGQLQQVGRLAAGGGAGVQHARAGGQAGVDQQRRGAAASCTETAPSAKPGRRSTGTGAASTICCGAASVAAMPAASSRAR